MGKQGLMKWHFSWWNCSGVWKLGFGVWFFFSFFFFSLFPCKSDPHHCLLCTRNNFRSFGIHFLSCCNIHWHDSCSYCFSPHAKRFHFMEPSAFFGFRATFVLSLMFLQRSGSKACNSGIDTCCLCPWMQQDDTCHWTALPFLRECQISGGKQWICAVIWHCCGSIRLNCFQSSVILSGLWCCCECQEVSTPHFAALQVPIMFQWTITFVSLKLSEPCLVQPGSWLF